MKVLVTGAAGFVGAAVMESLRSRSAIEPVGLVRHLEVSAPADLRACGDLGQVLDWRPFLEGIDVLVHCAARAHVQHDEADDPRAVFRSVNTHPTLLLARHAAEAGVRRFVLVSSIGVLGRAQERPFRASDPASPEEPYAASKWEAEQGLQLISSDTGLEVVVVRPPLVYGPRAPGNFGKLLEWVARGVPLPLGAVHNRRSFVGLDNLVDLLVTCVGHPGATNQVFLAGDGEDLSTTDLLRRVAVAMGKRPRLFPVSPSLLRGAARAVGRGEMAQRLLDSLQVDISHTRETLGWEPPVSVDEGLRRAVAPLLERGR